MRFPPKPHQIVGTQKLIDNRVFALFDEVGAGKSKQVIDAAFALHARCEIEAVLIVAPGSARSVWCDPDPVLGEVAKHAWDAPHVIGEYHRKTTQLRYAGGQYGLSFVTTNYEFVRRAERLEPLLDWVKRRRVLLVLDESWMVANKSQQWAACDKLARVAARVVLLNGTPGDPKAIYYQFALLDRTILGFRNFYAFRAHHAVMGGWMNKQIVKWQHLEELQAKTAPFALRRLTRDCFDLGDPPNYVTLDVVLTPATWKIYKAMATNLIAWLDANQAAVAGQAAVKVLRLAQIAAGFVGGLEGEGDLLGTTMPTETREVGREKLDAVIAWLTQSTPNKAVLWGRFRPEVERTALALREAFGDLHRQELGSHQVELLYGGQKPDDRERAKRLLAPGGSPQPGFVVGSVQAGGAGLNLAAADTAIYLTNTFSLKDRKQSEGRLDRPGQTKRVTFVDVVAWGPAGQKTIDHHVVKALRKKQELADWTASVWRQKLAEE